VDGIFQRQLQCVLHVRTTACTTTPATATAEDIAEDIAESIAKTRSARATRTH
tara:strand:- start:40 stop:198 length:159 start_codon:yes stop_codon:yes gene_type:complete